MVSKPLLEPILQGFVV